MAKEILGDVVLAVVSVSVCIVLVTMLVHIWQRVPFVPTGGRVVEQMVMLAKLKKGDRVYDLGAGDGRFLIAAKRQVPGIVATGFEVAPAVWMLGQLRIWWSGLAIRYRFADFMKADVSDADVIFLFLSPAWMVRLSKKFAVQLRPGTLIVSQSFRFKDRKPLVHKKVPMRLGGDTNVYVYKW